QSGNCEVDIQDDHIGDKRPVALSGIVLFSGLAGYQGPLQADCLGGCLGDLAAVADHGDFSRPVWKDRPNLNGWSATGTVLLCGTRSLDIFFFYSDNVWEQFGQQCEPYHQSLFPSQHYSRVCGFEWDR